MDAETLVYVDSAGARISSDACGRARKNKEGATFEYDGEWLKRPARFSLEPALTLGPGPFDTGDSRRCHVRRSAIPLRTDGAAR